MKKSGLAATLALLFAGTLACGVMAACTSPAPTGEFDYSTEILSDMSNPTEGYNSNLFYLNNLDFEIADPTVIQITEGEEKGYFYVYGTSDEIGCNGIQAWRSKDLSHWETTGIALEPDHANTWASEAYWAPEIIYDEQEKIYYLFYNAYNMQDENRLWLSVATSKHPAGPFVAPNGFRNANGEMLKKDKPVFDVTESNSILQARAENGELTLRTNALDAHPFIDPKTGDKYMYFAYRYDVHGTAGTDIYGMKMKDWFSPDYSTMTRLTAQGFMSVEAAENSDTTKAVDEGKINEGPFMMYHNDKYYLTFSIFPTHTDSYRVKQAYATSPLGAYTKIDETKGGTLISTDVQWEQHIVTAGHHCFVRCGEETLIAYHTYKNRTDYFDGRALAVDRIAWVTNQDGLEVMHTNGPTYSLQALPESVSGYKNIAPLATVTADNTLETSNVALLTDGLIKLKDGDCATEYKANTGVSTIKLTWDDFKDVRAIMIYNSYEYKNAFDGIARIDIEFLQSNGQTGTKTINNLPFDWNWYCNNDYQLMLPGGSAIAEFYEMPVKSITVYVRSTSGADYLALGEIMVLGKDSKGSGVQQFKEYTYENQACGSPHISTESLTFGTHDENYISTMYGYDLSHDDGTENAYITQHSVGQQAAYFKDVYDTTFYAEAEFTVTQDNAFMNDEAPKFGMLVSCAGKTPNRMFYYVDARGYNTSMVGFAQEKLDGSDWDWKATEQLASVKNMNYTAGKYVKLAILRLGEKFYFICDDKVVLTYDTFHTFTADKEAAVGFMCFNTALKIKNYSATTDTSVIEEMTEKYASELNVEQPDWKADNVLKILTVGNSFSDDTMEYVGKIASSMNVEFVLGNLYIGGCAIDQHELNLVYDYAAYEYRTYENGQWKTQNNYVMRDALKATNWDFISFQQASGYSGRGDSFVMLNSLLTQVRQAVGANPKFVWNMTWAYQGNSTHNDFAHYDKDQTKMYNAIVNVVKGKVQTNKKFALISPTGTAIQNARTSYLGDTLTRDGYHLNLVYGRYIAGLTFFSALTGLDISEIEYAPSGIDENLKEVCIESVNNALANAFKVTQSTFTE